jgi:hypothetical protein
MIGVSDIIACLRAYYKDLIIEKNYSDYNLDYKFHGHYTSSTEVWRRINLFNRNLQKKTREGDWNTIADINNKIFGDINNKGRIATIEHMIWDELEDSFEIQEIFTNTFDRSSLNVQMFTWPKMYQDMR